MVMSLKESMLSVGDSPANHFPQLENERAQMTSVTSGLKCSESLRRLDPLGSLVKMLLGYSQWSNPIVPLSWKTKQLYARNRRWCSKQLGKTLKKSGINPSQLLYQLVPSVRGTRERESGLLPTPTATATDATAGAVLGKDDRYTYTGNGTLRRINKNGHNGSVSLGRLVKLLPTPQARDYITGDNPDSPRAIRKREQGWSQNLNDVVKLLPTSATQDAKNCTLPPIQRDCDSIPEFLLRTMFPTPSTGAGLCGGTGNFNQLKKLEEQGVITDYERRQMSQGNGGQLNPEWVEWLMGFPVGWTDVNVNEPLDLWISGYWDQEPDGVPRVAKGVPKRVDRIKALGNAVVPQIPFIIGSMIVDLESRE